MIEKPFVGAVKFALVRRKTHADENANEVDLFQGDGIFQDVVNASVRIDVDVDDRGESARVGDEETGDLRLILIDRRSQRIGIDEIFGVDVAIDPSAVQNVFDAFQRTLFNGDDERRLAVVVLLQQALQRLNEGETREKEVFRHSR